VIVRICNRNSFHKQEQSVGIVYEQEQWEQSSLNDVYTFELLKAEKNFEYLEFSLLCTRMGFPPGQDITKVTSCALADYLSNAWKL
jgi:hypothetical protein